MSEYSSSIKLATNLIAKKGKNIVITRSVSTAFDPVLGVDASSNESMTVKAVVMPASGGKIAALDLRLKSSSNIYDRLSFFLMSGEGVAFKPEPEQKVLIEGETWIILGVTPLNVNEGDPIRYDVAIRI